MADEEREIIQNVRANIEDAREKFKSLIDDRDKLNDAPNVENALTADVQRALEACTYLENQLNRAENAGVAQRSRMMDELREGMKDIGAISGILATGLQQYEVMGVNAAKIMFRGFSAQTQRELNAATPQLMNAIRTSFKKETTTSSGIAKQMMGNISAQPLISSILSKGVSSKDLESYIQMLVAPAVGLNRTRGYMNTRYGAQSSDSVLKTESFMPSGVIREMWRTGGYQRGKFVDSNAGNNLFLSNSASRKLANTIANNPAAFRAAQKVNLLTHGGGNRYDVRENITANDQDKFIESVYKDVERRAQGMPSRHIDFYNQRLSEEDQIRLNNRMLSGTTGIALDALHEAAALMNVRNFRKTPKNRAFSINNVPIQNLEQYEIDKYSITDLMGAKKGATVNPRKISLSESTATRMLNLSGHHNEYTDKIVEVDLSGVDLEDEKTKKFLSKAFSGQDVKIGKSMNKFVSMHTDNQGVTMRFFKSDAYKDVYEKYKGLQNQLGLAGDNVQKMFVGTNHHFKDFSEFARYVDATNKIFSPSSAGSGITDKHNFGFIDLTTVSDGIKKKFADGVGYVVESLMPSQGSQARFGFGGKGMVHALRGVSNIYEWAEQNNMIDEVLKNMGLENTKENIDYLKTLHGLFDVSSVKNMQAYSGLNDVKKRNAAFTGLVRATQIGSMRSIESMETEAESLGMQAMQYMNLDPKFVYENAKRAVGKIKLLQTDVGAKAQASGSRNGTARRAILGENPAVASNDIQRMVDNEIQSILRRVGGGEQIDFNGGSIKNMALTESLTTALLQKEGTTPGKIRENLQKNKKIAANADLVKALRNEDGSGLSDDDLRGIFALSPGTGLDFSSDNKTFAANRAPTALGQLLAKIKNYATNPFARQIHEALGNSTEGLFLNYEDQQKLSNADLDGDKAKIIYGRLADIVAKNAENQNAALSTLGNIRLPSTTQVEGVGTDFAASSSTYGLWLAQAQKSRLGLGMQDTSGARAAALGQFDPQNLLVAKQAAEGYVKVADSIKEATEVSLTPEQQALVPKGRPFARFAKNFTSFFDVYGNNDIPKPREIFKTDYGINQNIDEMRKHNLNRIMPKSVYQDNNIISLVMASGLSGLGVNTAYADALLQGMQFLNKDYDDATSQLVKSKKLRDMYAKMNAYQLIGAYGGVTDEDYDLFNKAYTEANQEVDNYVKDILSGKIKPVGVEVKNGTITRNGHSYSGQQYASNLKREHSLDLVNMLLSDIGFTDKNIRRVHGNSFDSNSMPLAFTSLFGDKENTISFNERIARLQEAVGFDAAYAGALARLHAIKQGYPTNHLIKSGLTYVEPWMAETGEGKLLTLEGLTKFKAGAANEEQEPLIFMDRKEMEKRIADAEENTIRVSMGERIKTNGAMALGTIMHKAFELYYSGRVKNASDAFGDLISGNLKSEYFKDSNNKTGQRELDNVTNALQALQNEGIIDDKGNIKEGFGGDDLKNKIRKLSAGGRNNPWSWFTRKTGAKRDYIAEANIEYAGQDIVDATADYTMEGPKGLSQQRFAIRPDLMSIDENGKITMYDYKSSLAGAKESIVQMNAYVAGIERVSEQYLKLGKKYENKTKEEIKNQADYNEKEYDYYQKLRGVGGKTRNGNTWDQSTFGSLDEKGNFVSNFAKVVGANIIDKEGYQLDLTTGIGRSMVDQSYEQYLYGLKQRAADAKAGDKLGADQFYNEEIKRLNLEGGYEKNAASIAAVRTVHTDIRAEEMRKKAEEEGKEITLSPQLMQRFSQDAEVMDQIERQMAKQEKYAQDLPDRGYSVFHAARKQLADTLTDENLALIKAKYDKDSLEYAEVDARIKRSQEQAAKINEVERAAVPHNVAHTTETFMQIATGMKEDPQKKQQEYMDYQLSMRYAEVNEMKRAEYLNENGEWKQDDESQRQKKAYEEARDAYQKLKEETNEKYKPMLEQRIKNEKEFQINRNLRAAVAMGDDFRAQQEIYSDQYALNRLRKATIPFVSNSALGRNYINRLQQNVEVKQQIAGTEKEIRSYEDAVKAEEMNQSRIDQESKAGKTKEQELEATASQTKIEEYKNKIKDQKNNLGQLKETNTSDIGAALAAGFDTATQAVERFVTRIGRQVLQRAINEARQFVLQFSTEMSQIQAITLKSDDEMVAERAKNISQAQTLHTTVSNVAATRAALYRQGLSESEVDDRTEAIIKFATVTGAKVTDATKYLTTAVKTGLVGSVEEAMDVLVALGDTAATTAEEISKGMQKSAAAAKTAGVSYNELSAMLTVITSKTQLGGNQAGTALQTIFSRITRVTKAGSVTDSSGSVTTVNDVEKALNAIGINLRNPNNKTEIRGAYEILYELSQRWNELNDLQRGNVTYALAGGRQVNMFTSLMEGLAENNGEDLKELFDKIENGNAEGIVDEKYELAIRNVQTALTDLKNAWDGLVESVTSNGFLETVINFATDIVTGIKSATESMSPLEVAITALGVALGGLIVKLAAVQTQKSLISQDWIGAAMGAAVLIGGGVLIGKGIADAYSKGNEVNQPLRESDDAKREIQTAIKAYNQRIDKTDKQLETISKAKKIVEEWNNGEIEAATASDKLKTSLSGLSEAFPQLKAHMDAGESTAAEWVELLSDIEEQANNSKDAITGMRQEMIMLDIKEKHGKMLENVAALEEKKLVPFLSQTVYLNNNENAKKNIEFLIGNGEASQWTENRPQYLNVSDAFNFIESQAKNQYNNDIAKIEDYGSNIARYKTHANNIDSLYDAIYKSIPISQLDRLYNIASFVKGMGINDVNTLLKDPEVNSILEDLSGYGYENILTANGNINDFMSRIDKMRKSMPRSYSTEVLNILNSYLNGGYAFEDTSTPGNFLMPFAQLGFSSGMTPTTEYEKNVQYALSKLAQDASEDPYFNYGDFRKILSGEIKVSDLEAEQNEKSENILSPEERLIQQKRNLLEGLLFGNSVSMGSNQTMFFSPETQEDFKNLISWDYGEYGKNWDPELVSYISAIGGIDELLNNKDAFNKLMEDKSGMGKLFYNAVLGARDNYKLVEDRNAELEKQIEQLYSDYIDYFVDEYYYNLDEVTKDVVTQFLKDNKYKTVEEMIQNTVDWVYNKDLVKEMNARAETPTYVQRRPNQEDVAVDDIYKVAYEDKPYLYNTQTNTYVHDTFGKALTDAYQSLTPKAKGFKDEYSKFASLLSENGSLEEQLGKAVEGSGLDNFLELLMSDNDLIVALEQARVGGETERAALKNYVNSKINGTTMDERIGKILEKKNSVSISKGVASRIKNGKLTRADQAKIASRYGISLRDYLNNPDFYNDIFIAGVTTDENAIAKELSDYAQENNFWNAESGWNNKTTDKRMLNFLKSYLDEDKIEGENGTSLKYLKFKGITPESFSSSLIADNVINLQSQINEWASAILGSPSAAAAEDIIKSRYGEENFDTIIESIKSQHPELYQWLNMSEEQRNSVEGQNIKRNIDITFNVSGMTELEKAGKIISGLTDTLIKMQSANPLEAFQAKENMFAQFGQAQQAFAAINALNSGETISQEQWSAIASFAGISNISDFQSGKRSKTELNNLMSNAMGMYEKSVNDMFQAEANKKGKVVQLPDGSSFIAGEDGQVTQDVIDAYKAQGFKYENGRFSFDYENATALQTYNAAMRARENVSDFKDYRSTYRDQYGQFKDVQGLTQENLLQEMQMSDNADIRAQAGIIGKDINFQNIKAGDTNGILRYLFQQGYGTQYNAGYYSTQSNEVQKFVSDQLGGVINFEELEKNEELANYVKGQFPDYEEYASIISKNQELAGYQIEDVQKALAERRAQEAEQRREVKAGTAQAVAGIYSRDWDTQFGVVSGFAQGLTAADAANRQMNAYLADRNNATARAGQASYLGTSEATLREATPEQIRKWFTDKQKSVNDGLEDFMKQTFDVKQFSDFDDQKSQIAARGDATKMALYDSIVSMFELAGIAIENGRAKIQNDFDVGEYISNASGMAKREQTGEDLRTLYNYIAGGGEFDEMQFSHEVMTPHGDYVFEPGEGKRFVQDGYTLSREVDEERWKAVVDSMPNSYAKDALEKWRNGEALSDIEKAYIRDADTYLNAVNSDDYNRLMSEYFLQTFGTSFNQMNAGQFSLPEGFDMESLAQSPMLLEWLKGLEGGVGSDFLSELNTDGQATVETIQKLTAVMSNLVNNEMKKYGDRTKTVTDQQRKLRGSTEEQAEVYQGFVSTISKAQDNQYYREQWKSGSRSSDTQAAISRMTNWSTEQLSKGMFSEGLLSKQLEKAEEADMAAVTDYVNAFAGQALKECQEQFNALTADQKLELTGLEIEIDEGQISVPGIDNFSGPVQEYINNVVSNLQGIFSGTKFTGTLIGSWLNDFLGGTFNLIAQSGAGGLGSGARSGGGGGGGGGKSATDKLIEKLKNEIGDIEHKIKMVQYAESKYQNRGELTNYGNALKQELVYQKQRKNALEDAIAQQKRHMGTLSASSDEWRKAFDQMKKYEEELADTNNTIEENIKKQKENKSAIAKTQIAVENQLAEEFENRKQKERSMLDSRVQLENAVLDTIRKRYQDEWELIQKDVEKKKEALNEEIALIDKRLQRRKDAADEAEKYEELAELQNQLAMISMDPTRNKDAAELRERISELQKDIGWDIAEDQAAAEKEVLQEQIDAYDDFLQKGAEDLQKFLEDANNFSAELDNIMSKSRTGILNWLKDNNEDYKNATENGRKQILQSWNDTIDGMKGIVENYWKQIKILMQGSRDDYINFMKGSDEWRNASKKGREELVKTWGDTWDTWRKAIQNDRNDDSHDDKKPSGKSSNNNNNNKNQQTPTPDKNKDEDKENNKAKDNNGGSALGTLIGIGAAIGRGILSGVGKAFGISTPNTYDEGGYVNYTGLAAVHGSALRPEAFLDADDTKLMRSMLDAMNIIRMPSMSAIDSTKFAGTNQTIGDISIEIKEASFKDDADQDEVAKELGDRFVKELGKQGMMMANYSF